MSTQSQLKARYLSRLDQLIAEGEGIPFTSHSRVTGGNYLTGAVHTREYELVSFKEFVEWRTSCVAVIEQVVPNSSVLRPTVMAFPNLDNKPSARDSAVAFLRAVRREVEAGSFDALASRIEAESLSDYLEQAEALVEDRAGSVTHVAAAVIVGAALERCLRVMCSGLEPSEPTTDAKGNPLTLTPLIEALKRRQVFNELQAKELRTWSSLRNHAAHGQFDQFTRDQVASMVDGVLRFAAAYAA